MSITYSSKLESLLSRIKGVYNPSTRQNNPNRNFIYYYYMDDLYMVEHVFHLDYDKYTFMKIKPIGIHNKGKILGHLTNKDLNYENVKRIVVSGYSV